MAPCPWRAWVTFAKIHKHLLTLAPAHAAFLTLLYPYALWAQGLLKYVYFFTWATVSRACVCLRFSAWQMPTHPSLRWSPGIMITCGTFFILPRQNWEVVALFPCPFSPPPSPSFLFFLSFSLPSPLPAVLWAPSHASSSTFSILVCNLQFHCCFLIRLWILWAWDCLHIFIVQWSWI